MVEKLPEGTTFLFHVANIQPKHGKSSLNPSGRWLPPVIWNEFAPDAIIPANIWRWRDDKIVHEKNTFKLHSHPDGNQFFHGAATVFARMPSLDEFVAFPQDVRRFNIINKVPNKWMEIGFRHDQVPGRQRHHYNYVSCVPAQEQFNSRTQSSWQQLFTPRYNPEATSSREPVNAGLTGDLALILALVAFSCRTQHFEEVILETKLLRTWKRHVHPHGRTQNRGVVVTVWTDPNNEKTTKDVLTNLERGKYGPIFGPNPPT